MRIWIINHYATNMFFDKAGRHYWFAEHLRDKGYEVKIFCAATFLNNNEVIDTGKEKFIEKAVNSIPFVFVKTVPSQINGLSRIKNWFLFYKNVISVAKKLARSEGKPDLIIASSPHLLTMVAGIKISKKLKTKSICEIRDLWPENIFSFGKAKEKSLVGKVLIKIEHWLYKSADALIFTKEGDTDYLKERGWTTEQGGDIDLKKCHYINNGVDLADYENKITSEQFADSDLSDDSTFNVVYCGTIRPVNNVGNLLDAAALLKEVKGYDDVRFLIFGGGIQLEELKKRVADEKLDNVKLKGFVEKKYVPYILSKSDVNILNYSQSRYNWSRGNSSNKLFEYMASGKPIISTVRMGYSIIKKYDCGVELSEDTPRALADQIISFHDMSVEEREKIGVNAKNGAKDFDFDVLTDKLIDAINEVV